MNKKIIITATFRDFNGNSNDKIQRLFLKSIKNQTNQNYLLAVTLFGEKNVTNVLTEEKIPFITFQGDAGEHRYSLTQVLLNGIKAAKENKDSIILWTTCDVIFDPDFFEKIVAKTKSRTCGTSYPHLTYPSVDDYKGKRNGHLLWYGIDSIFYSSDVFTEPAAEEALKKYPSEGWGHGDFFFTAFGLAFYENVINIRNYSKIQKIENDRNTAGETGTYFDADTKNTLVFRQFVKDYHIGNESGISINSTIFFLSYKFDSIKEIWINISVYILVLTYPIKRSIGISIHMMKLALKKLIKYDKKRNGEKI